MCQSEKARRRGDGIGLCLKRLTRELGKLDRGQCLYQRRDGGEGGSVVSV